MALSVFGKEQRIMKDGTAKNAFCLQERAREKTGEMLTNTLIPLENRNSSTHGS